MASRILVQYLFLITLTSALRILYLLAVFESYDHHEEAVVMILTSFVTSAGIIPSKIREKIPLIL